MATGPDTTNILDLPNPPDISSLSLGSSPSSVPMMPFTTSGSSSSSSSSNFPINPLGAPSISSPAGPPVSLREYQMPCVQNVLRVWEKGAPAIISAQTGSGKTYMGAMSAYLYGAHYVFVIGPKSSISKWGEVLSLLFPRNNIYCCTYESWRSCGTRDVPRGSQPYTYKLEMEREEGGLGYDFDPSELWNSMVWNHKCVLILDEFHKLQKSSQRTYSVCANTRSIVLYDCPSRLLALSYTPCDNLSDIPMHLYLLGMTNGTHLAVYDHHTKIYNTTGLQGVLELATSFSPVDLEDKHKVINAKYLKGRGTHRMVNGIAGELFLKYIRKHIVFSCQPDFVNDPALTPDYNNYFCRVSEHASRTILTVVHDRGGDEKHIAKFIHKVVDSGDMGFITRIQQDLEKIKYPIYLEVAREWLLSNPNGKVAIMVLYLDTMDIMCENLREYNPMRIEGCMTTEERDVSIRTFQSHNTDTRVLVATLMTGGESIDLHDTSPNGSYPRLIIIPPCFYTKNIIQSTGRVFRDGVTSKPTVKIIYTISPNDISVEERFYQAVARKTDVVKQYHAEDQNAVLPCDFENVTSQRTYLTSVDTPVS